MVSKIFVNYSVLMTKAKPLNIRNWPVCGKEGKEFKAA